MATFPLLNLSPADSERILRSLTLGELFDLSQCSKRTFTLIKNFCSKTPDSNLVIATYAASSCYSMQSRGSLGSAYWVFLDERDARIMDVENPKTYKIAGCEPMSFCISRRTPTSVDYSCVSRHSAQDILNFGEYLLTLFNGYVTTLEIKPNQINFLEDISSIDAICKCTVLWLHNGKLSHRNLRKILESVETDFYRISCSTRGSSSPFAQPIKCIDFSINNASWVDLQFLQNLDCKNGNIHDCSLGNEDLNKYLKSWLAGSNTKLEYITIAGDKHAANKINLSLSKIVEGIPNTPGVAKRRDATTFELYQQEIDYATGVDLRRDSDGMLATVLIYQDTFWGATFLFVVWQVPNPNLVVVVP